MTRTRPGGNGGRIETSGYRLNIADSAADVVAKVSRSAAASVAGVRTQLDMADEFVERLRGI